MVRMELKLKDSAATEALGASLARTLPPLMAVAVLYMVGELGAGKTAIVRALLRAAGVRGTIRSPTYSLVEVYTQDAVHFVHVDLYRMATPAEVDDLGLRDFGQPGHLILIEWPERGGAGVPPADVQLRLTYEGNGRRACLSGKTALGRQWLENLAHDKSLNCYLSNLT